MIPFAITMILLLLGIYYVTVFLHFFGVTIFKKMEINPLTALIPFYYWFKRDVTK